ncbi:MAG: DUF3626 domain-containing protein [Proteobacteria bacterium]|nr:DUF3626 domain-containing protein [Pseudomonadota bacterium]
MLKTAPPTTNISSKLFMLPGFLNTTSVDTMWTRDAGKGWTYTQKRDNVEAPLFGYKTDWSVPVKEAALNRPVYAGLNYVRHPYGSAAAYGSVVLTFVPAVTQRVTIIHADTFSSSFGLTDGTPTDDQIFGVKKKIATIAQVETIMANMSKNQLKALMEYTLTRYNYTEHPPNYVEIHVQGGLEWQRDLLEISVATSGATSLASESKGVTGGEAAVKAKIKEFAEKFDVTAKVYDVERVTEVLNTGGRSARVA